MKVLIAGGGTGGHLFPGIALAEALRRLEPAAEIHFVGSSRGLEARLLPEEGWPCHFLAVRGFPRRFSAALAGAAAAVPVAMVQAMRLLVTLQPRVVVGMGGYASGPAVAAGILVGRPTAILEQNLTPGLTTRWLAPFVNEVHVSFPETRERLRRRRGVYVSGNPVRERVLRPQRAEAVDRFGLDRERATLVVLGGSRGAHSLNRIVAAALPLIEDRGTWQCLFQCGEADAAEMSRLVASLGLPVQVHPFWREVGLAYAAADLVVCRAGATTVAEIAARGLPAILVPYPWAAGGHQEENAQWMVRAGAALLARERDTQAEHLARQVSELLRDRKKRAAMAAAAARLGKPAAATEVARAVLALSR